MSSYTVKTTGAKGHQKRLSVAAKGGQTIAVMVPRYAMLGKGDEVLFDPEHLRNVFAGNAEIPDDPIRISPHFEESSTVQLGGESIQSRVTEIAAPCDLDALSYLEQFHYKTVAAQSPEESEKESAKTSTVGGRKSVLVLYLKLGGEWQAAGYVELQMPFLMVKPRHDLFHKGFKHPTRPIGWERWDQHAIREYVNLIVRVARIVVAPDLRGMGLARQLIEAAQKFSTERWQVGGRRPLFLEISAEMLNYVDFVSSSGFYHVGNTEGNIKRVVDDLSHMSKGYEVTSGIMSLQKKYLDDLLGYCDRQSQTMEDVLERLREITSSPDPTSALTSDEWLGLRSVIRFPIPYYLCALDDAAKGFLRANLKAARGRRSTHRVEPARLRIRGLRVHSFFRVPHTQNTRMVMDAFGIQSESPKVGVLGPMDIDASAGNIFFVAGTSGSGKSALLQALDTSGRQPSSTLLVSARGIKDYTTGWIKPVPADVPLFEYFAEHYTPQRAFAALSHVGLSEAFVFLKPFPILSRGQRYRAMLADLLLRDSQVWLIDEFCSDLDPLTAAIVCQNLRKQVMRSRRICFIAAANHGHFLHALRPTRVIVLTAGAPANTMTYKEYRDGIHG